jgi:hypothetical protein
MTDLKTEITKMESELNEKQTEIERLINLSEIYPDTKKHVNRWKTVRYYNKMVNDKVTNFDMKHNCGCCSDSPLEVWPYLETEYGKLYSDPPCFTVGERSISYYTDTPYSGWDAKMRDAKIPESIIAKIQAHFDSCKESIMEDASNFISDKY